MNLEVLVTAKLGYDSGVNWNHEGLYVIIKFKEKGKLFRTKLKRWLLRCDNSYQYYEEYAGDLFELSKDKETVINKVESIVKEYFKDRCDNQDLNNKVNEALSRLGEMKKFEVKVKIK